MREVKRHTIKNLEIAKMGYDGFRKRLAKGFPVLEKKPDYLGNLISQTTSKVGEALVLDATKEEALENLRYLRDFGVAHFRLSAQISGNEALMIGGNQHFVQGNAGTAFTQFSYWLPVLRAAAILRDIDAVKSLLAAAEELYGSDLEELEIGERTEAVFYTQLLHGNKAAARKALTDFRDSTKGDAPLYREKLKLPLVEVWENILDGNHKAAEAAVAGALQSHKDFWGSDENWQNADGWISLPLLHACAYAYDHGMKIDVESDYIPRWLYMGEGIK
ncbi:MAG: hypothetical protein RLZZ519_3472 [Bacteroidota bacterium]|jgi:hypothetical protein